jgi:hypothetical protein
MWGGQGLGKDVWAIVGFCEHGREWLRRVAALQHLTSSTGLQVGGGCGQAVRACVWLCRCLWSFLHL